MPSPGDTPEGMNAQSYLAKLAFEGMKRRYPIVTPEHEERLRFELDVIEKTGFGQYFLIVRDFANFARREGIFFGVRGSAAGSMASYCVGITDVDPIEYGLTFERFLNPERISMPDIDMDFEDGRRQDVIDYVVQKYGRDRVAQIITFGTLAARAAIRDCGRAMNKMPMPEVDKLCKMIPTLPVGIKLTPGAGGQPRVQGRLRRQPAGPRADRHRPAPGRADPPRQRPRRGRRHRRRPALGERPAAEGRRRRRPGHAVPGGQPGKDRPAQDGLPGPGEPDHPGPGRQQRQAEHGVTSTS